MSTCTREIEKKKEIPQYYLPGSSSHRSIKIHKNLYFFFIYDDGGLLVVLSFFFEKLP